MTQLKIKLGKLRAMHETAAALVTDQTTGASRRWPAKFAYWLARLIAKTTSEYEVSDKARIALAEELGEKSEDGLQYVFKGEAGQEFNVRYNALLDTDIEIDLPSVAIGSLENVEIEPAVLLLFDELVVETL